MTPLLFFVLTLLAGLTIPVLPLLTTLFPRLGLLPLQLGHHRLIRLLQVTLVWVFAALTLWTSDSVWGWLAVLLALWFSFVGAKFYPERIFVALEQPKRDLAGLAESAAVLAAEAGGEVVAYPLETLIPHHIVNDFLGGSPVLATWCAACRSGLVYAAQARGRHLTFDVYGVWRKNMVMKDRETGSLWQQATGEAIAGSLKGKHLEVLPAWETTWGELRASHPQAQYAMEPELFAGLLPKSLLQRALHVTQVAHAPGLAPRDKRLDTHELVIGVVVHGEAKAYPLAALRSAGTIHDRLGGEDIVLEYIPPGDRVSVSTSDGKRLQHEREWWLGWSEFHPRSSIYDVKGSDGRGVKL